MELAKEELLEISGGASFSLSGTLLNGIAKIFGILTEIGQNVGSAIRRGRTGEYCPVK